MTYINTFEPLKIGTEISPNRLGLAPMNTGLLDNSGHPNEGFNAFHRLYALSGLGVIFIGGVAVSNSGRASARSLALDCPEKAVTLSKTISAIRNHGIIPVIQLMHAGRQADPVEIGEEIVAPSSIPCPIVGATPHELSVGQIRRIIKNFVSAAEFGRMAGIRTVELHAAHGYLIAEFLSPRTNRRADEYGGSFRNRFRFLDELIRALRAVEGIDVGVRISGDEFVAGGLSINEIPELVTAIQDEGAVYVSISAGVYNTDDHIMPDRQLGEAVYAPLGLAAKRVAKIPIFIAGNVSCLDSVECLLYEGCADLVLMGRALLADPLLIQKSMNCENDQIKPCTMCRICKYHSRDLPHISCPHNDLLWGMVRATILQEGHRLSLKQKRLPAIRQIKS